MFVSTRGTRDSLIPVGKPSPVSTGNPHPWARVRVLAGVGAGCRKKPQGDPCFSLTTVVILQKINRQSGTENERFVDLLSRLHEGCCTSANYNLLNSRVISVIRNINQWNISIRDFAPVIVCDNTTKDAVNLEIAQVFASKTGQPFCTYASVDEIDGAPITDPNVLKIIELIHSGRTSNKLKDLLYHWLSKCLS